MAWTIKYADVAQRALNRLDKREAKRIAEYMDNRVAVADSPRSYGQALTGSLSGLWRYRVGDYRVICEIRDKTICVLVLEIGHRGDVYRKH